MIYDEELEKELLEQLEKNPDEPIVFDKDDYDQNGNIQISHNYLRRTLLRHLWIKVRGPLEPKQYLHQVSGPEGDQNPWHYAIGHASQKELNTQCRNGHPKLGPGRCETCYQGRLERLRIGGLNSWERNAIKTFCPQGHPYDTANTRIITNRETGRQRRQCRACETNYRERKKRAAYNVRKTH